jgi:hypothetical protein
MFEEDRDFDAEIEHMDGIEDEPEDAFGWQECAFCGCPLNEDEERAGVCDLCR